MLRAVERWKKASVIKYGVNNPRSRLDFIIIIIIIITLIIIIIIIIYISFSPLFRVATHIFLRQTMSLGDTLLQLFSLCCLWCLYV